MTFRLFTPAAHKGRSGFALGEELLAVELIHALTRREEISFIPTVQEIFFVRETV